MHDQIERMVERRYGGDHTDGFVLGEGHTVLRSRVQSHRNHVTALGAQHLDAVQDAVDATLDFGDRVLQRLAAFAGRLGRDLQLARGDQFGRPLQDFNALRLGQPLAAVAKNPVGDAQCLFDIRLGGHRHLADDGAVVRGVHSQGLYGHGAYLVGDKKAVDLPDYDSGRRSVSLWRHGNPE